MRSCMLGRLNAAKSNLELVELGSPDIVFRAFFCNVSSLFRVVFLCGP
jgi:hypothetical protein